MTERTELVDLWNKYHPNEKIGIVAAPAPAPAPKPVPKPAPKPPAPKPAPRPAHTFGIDISGYNNPNLAILKPHGVQYVWSQVTDGRGFADGNFRTNWEASRRYGIAFGAYHFLRSTSSVSDQADNVARHIVDKRIPISIDCEPTQGSRPNLGTVRAFIAALHARDLRVGLLYLPHWYWVALGRPSLKGLPPLWQSSYGRNSVGSPANVYAQAGGDRSAAGWTQQGGIVPSVFQFGSEIRIPGYAGALDADVYRGPVSELIHRGILI